MASIDVSMSQAGSQKKRKASKSPAKRRKFVPLSLSEVKSPAIQRGSAKPERKWMDTDVAQPFSSNGAFVLLNGLSKGLDVFQRVGRRINLTRVSVKGQLFINQAGASPGPDFLRLMLVYDREANSATPAIGDLLQDTSNVGATTSTATSFMNLNATDRFAILKQWQWATPGPVDVTVHDPPAGQQAFPTMSELSINYTKKINLDVRYTGSNTGTIADITTGSLFLVWVGMQTPANSQWSSDLSMRIRFTDS